MLAPADTTLLAPAIAPRRGRYHSLRGSSATWWVAVCLLLYFPLWLLALASDGSDDEPPPTPTELWDAISTVTVMILVGVVVQFCALAVWQLRAYDNLHTFGVAPLRPSRGAIALTWLIPVVNVVVGARVLRDLWRGSAREASSNPDWRALRVPATLTFWWLTYWSAIVGALAIIVLPRPDELDHVSWRHWLAYADLAVLFLAARSGRRVMLAVRDRHRRRAGELGLAPVEPGGSDIDPDESGDVETLDASLLGWFALLGPWDGDGDGDDGDDGGGDGD